MPDLWSDLLACLDLRRCPPSGATDRREGSAEPGTALVAFEGPNLPLSYHRLFGGQILGQLIRAAGLAYPDKTVKSVHAIFAKEGRHEEPVRYEVACHHQGRSFATLTIIAKQRTAVVASASVSMHITEGGPLHQTSADIAPILPPEHQVTFDLLPWKTRPAADLNATASAASEYELPMRNPEVSRELASILTAYATDLNLLGTASPPVDGVSQQGNGTDFDSAVTSHTLWFHRPFGTADWLLLRQHSPVLTDGRRFGRGDVFTADGTLVASYAQEGLTRFEPDAMPNISATHRTEQTV